MASQLEADSVPIQHGDVEYDGKVILYVIKGLKGPHPVQSFLDTDEQ